jgi:hypothetical protein
MGEEEEKTLLRELSESIEYEKEKRRKERQKG